MDLFKASIFSNYVVNWFYSLILYRLNIVLKRVKASFDVLWYQSECFNIAGDNL